MSKFIVEWNDHGREPKCAPNPEYPSGIDVPALDPDAKACKVSLPYPARRCGYYVVECKKCGIRVGCTTAGRADDPRSITINCKAIMQ